MYPLTFTIVAVIVIPILTAYNKHKFLFVLALIGIATEGFFINIFSYRFFVSSYIGFIYFLFNYKGFFKNPTPLGKFYWYDLVSVSIVGTYFVYISPWDDAFESFRSITQKLPLRTLVGIIRTFEPLIGFFYFLNVVRSGKISLNFFVKSISITFIIIFIVGFIDMAFTAGVIRLFFVPEFRLGLASRFTGLSGEPRVVGYVAGITLLAIYPLLKKYPLILKDGKILRLGIFSCFLCIAAAFSTTAIVNTGICFIAYIFMGKVKVINIVIVLICVSVGFIVLSRNDEFIEHQQERINQVNLSEKTTKIDDVPDFINSFEQFDQIAAAFFYFNPEYLLLGVGPNTVNIPANKYNPDFAEIFVVDSTPSTGIIYTISRVGILGLIVLVLSLFITLKKIKYFNDSYISDSLTLLFLFRIIVCYYPPSFPFYSAIFLGTLMFESKKKEDLKIKHLQAISNAVDN